MKRQFMKGLMALCVGVMTLGASSSLFVSCDKYDDSELREQIDALDKRVQNLESVLKQLEELTARVDALYTLKFQVTTENELQYSFDGGNTWISTGIVLATQCEHECTPCQCVPCDHECPEVSLVDNGDSVTIKVGDAEFTIKKPEQIVFEIRAGKVYFESEGTMQVAIKSSGIEDITVMSAPKGWYAEINAEGKVEVTAPNYDDTQSGIDYETWTEIPAKYAASGYVKIHACSTEGKCMVGKLPVEVVAQALSVKAYGGNAYYTVATTSSWGPTFYYGATTKDALEAEVTPLLEALTSGNYNVIESYNNNGLSDDPNNVVVSIAELLGEEPQQRQEYVVWALVEDYSKLKYSVEDIVLAYYTPLSVTITEAEAERTAYNVTVNVDVVGAESYVAVAMPATYCSTEEDVAYQKEQMAMAMNQGQYYGQLYTENYSGSALDIAAETTYSMTGNYAPDSAVYVFILPLDGRANEDYTAADVVSASFTTAPLTSGGSINLTVKQVTEYMGQVYNYEIWDYVDQLITLDPYTELGVEVTPSNTTDWVAFYYQFLTPEQWADYGAYTEDVVDLLLEGYGMTPSEIKSWPQYLVEDVNPATTVHFVGFIVDKDGKYGELAHVELTSKELVKADFEWTEPFTTNLVDGVLKNNETFEFTPVLEDGAVAASYKYVWLETAYWNPYEGMDDAQMADEIFFSEDAVTVTAEELVDGKIVVEGHSYGSDYYFAVVPINEEGAPGKSAAIVTYQCVFAIDNVVTEGTAFDATAPQIEITYPTEYVEGGEGSGAMYYYEYQNYYKKNYFYYEGLKFSVAPVEGTTVCASMVDTDSYTMGDNAAVKAAQLWSGEFGSYYTLTTNEYAESSNRTFNNYEDEPAPAVVLAVSWVDADGNYYYKEYNMQPELKMLSDALYAMIYGEAPEEPSLPTPDGKQWAFTWMQMGGVPTVLDFGVTLDGQCVVAYDPAVMGAPEGTPYQIYNMVGYDFVPTDATSGKLVLTTTNMYGEELSQEFDYSNLTETSCHFEFDETSFVGEPVDGTPTEVTVDMSGGVM